MAKFWSFDVGAGGGILLESEAKVDTKTLGDFSGGVDSNKNFLLFYI